MSRLSTETIEKIYQLYDELHSYAAVARELGIGADTVSRHIKNRDKATDTNSKPQRKQRTTITSELKQQINEYFAFSLNYAETGRQFGISPATVKRHLNEENIAAAAEQAEDREALFYYIYHLFGEEADGMPISKWNLTQIERFKKQGINYKAQLLTLKYWYEIKHNTTEKSNRSIGIIPYIIGDSKAYYLAEVKRRKEIEEGIKKQLANDRITVKYKPGDYFTPPNRKKKTIDLDSVGEA